MTSTDATDEIAALTRTVGRLWKALAGVTVLSIVGLGLAAEQRLSVPDAVELRSGSRSAQLTPDGLVISLDNDQRVVIDAHSGIIVRDKNGRVAQLTGDQGVQRRGAPVGSGLREDPRDKK